MDSKYRLIRLPAALRAFGKWHIRITSKLGEGPRNHSSPATTCKSDLALTLMPGQCHALCVKEGAGNDGSLARANSGCDNNFDIWTAGTRFQYDFTGVVLRMGLAQRRSISAWTYSHLDSVSLPGKVLHNFVLV
jgi:hypothetical protein